MEATRAIENIEKWLPQPCETVCEYGIPMIQAEHSARAIERWVPFNHILAAGAKPSDAETGVQFFTQDYQFQRVWIKPDLYVPILLRYAAVLSPDFSLYTDMPKAMQIYNHYRKHWCGAYWQQHGITVIPTIAWSDESSLEWCFDGEPEHAVVAVSSVGTQRQGEDARRLFQYGYDAMIERLQPEMVLFWGAIPAGCRGNIVPVPPAYEWSNRRRDQKKVR